MHCSQIVKNFTLSLLVAFSCIIFIGCDKDENTKNADTSPIKDENAKIIDVVKNAVFPIDESRTLEEALSVNLADIQWKAYKSEHNQQIVEVIGTWQGASLSSQMYKGMMTRYYYCHNGNKITIKFVVNKNNSVKLAHYKAESNEKNLGIYNGDNSLMENTISMGSEKESLAVLYHMPK